MKVSNKTLLLGFLAVILVIYNVLLFVLYNMYNEFNMAFWLAYAFIMIAALLFIFSASGLAGGKRDYAIFGLPMLGVTLIYLAVEFILGTILMIVKSDNVFANLLPQLFLLIIYFALTLPALMAKNVIQGNQAKVKAKVSFIAEVSGMVQLAATTANDENLKKDLKRLADDIKYSDPMSHNSLGALERDIAFLASEIKDCAGNNENAIPDLIKRTKALLLERNIKCKTLK